ncbi:MAG: hypothetical protein PVH30_07075 [Desulfobacterales bacterium]|jgi:RecJ-like exonuclease
MAKSLTEAMVRAIEAMSRWPARTARLFHHNDADGISSGAIVTLALTRAGYGVDRCCLEKPYPPVLETIYRDRGALLVFADFAGRIAPFLSDVNQGRNLTIILDHHPAIPATDPCVHNLDPDLFGYRGDRDVSASTTCYRFAECLDPANRDLAYLAVAGAVGDGFFVDGRLAGLNRLAAEAAVAGGQLEIRPLPGGEAYRFRGPVHDLPVEDLAGDLDLFGGVGYFRGGPETGIRLCMEGYDAAADRSKYDLIQLRNRLYEAEIGRLEAGSLKVSGRIQWFQVAERFDGIGVKMIGAFCRYIRDCDFIDPNKYVAGFQPIPNTIPGMGVIEFCAVKVSMRVPTALEARIINGEMPGLDRLLPEATQSVGGFSDACHSLAAATTIPPGKEGMLVETLNAILQEWEVCQP